MGVSQCVSRTMARASSDPSEFDPAAGAAPAPVLSPDGEQLSPAKAAETAPSTADPHCLRFQSMLDCNRHEAAAAPAFSPRLRGRMAKRAAKRADRQRAPLPRPGEANALL
jgi:hypothetical protein